MCFGLSNLCGRAPARGVQAVSMKANTVDGVESSGSGAEAGSELDSSILIVDDDPGTVSVIGHILADVGSLRFATNGKDALRLARESAPDLVLLDAEMPGMSGFELFESLRAETALAGVPVIFLTSHGEASFEVSALEMGAVDFITKPFRSSLVLARVKTQLRVKHMAARLNGGITTDGLTGVANRRLFDEMLDREWRRTRRAGDPISLLLVDVDHFKLYNEHCGRLRGDACLQAVTLALGESCRRAPDLVARGGADEFMVLLPQTAREGADHVAHRILDAVQALKLVHLKSPTKGNITVSVGIGCYDENSACWSKAGPDHRRGGNAQMHCDASDLLLAANQALRAGKRERGAKVRFCDISAIDAPAAAESPRALLSSS
jgi:diguanylate cyclase (GGDEF)-like protein